MAKNIVSAISEAPSVMSNQLAEPFTDCIIALCSCFRTHNVDTEVMPELLEKKNLLFTQTGQCLATLGTGGILN